MTVTIDSTDPRAVKALALLAQSSTWTYGRRKFDGLAFAIVAGSKPGSTYMVSSLGCTCADANRRGVRCKHQTAYRLWTIQQNAAGSQPAAPAPKPAPSCRSCGGPLPAGTISGVCNADACFDSDVFAGVNAIKAAFGSRSARALSGPVVQLVGAA